MLIVLPGVRDIKESGVLRQRGLDAGAIQREIERLLGPVEHDRGVCEGTKHRKRLTYREVRLRGGKPVTEKMRRLLAKDPDLEELFGPETVGLISDGVVVELGVPVLVDPDLGIDPATLPAADLGNGVTANRDTTLTTGERRVLTFVAVPDALAARFADPGVWAALREITTTTSVG